MRRLAAEVLRTTAIVSLGLLLWVESKKGI
jgi:hypothetical protein